MNSFIQSNYKALINSAVITIILTILLNRISRIYIISSPGHMFVNFLSLVLCWWLIYFLISKISIKKVLGVLALLVTALLAEYLLQIGNNPITIPMLILFWLGVAYLVLPEFFNKYRIAILSVYAFVIISYYFFFFNMTPDYAEHHRLNFVNFLIIPLPFFAAFWVYEQWRWLKILKADKAKAELALLKSQINPHFFFNTLNNLYGLVVEKSAQAPQVVLKLSDMMRYTIYEGKEDLVNLMDEVKYLETYIELHKIRYQQKVDIQFKHEVGSDIQLAPLLFIILLENAFKHGVEKLTENAYIHLDLKTEGNQIFFTVKNNYDSSSPKQNKGIGLDNLTKRLTHIYPGRHELKIVKTDATYTAHLNLELNA